MSMVKIPGTTPVNSQPQSVLSQIFVRVVSGVLVMLILAGIAAMFGVDF